MYLAIKHFWHILEARNFIICIDQKPLTYAVASSSDRYSREKVNMSTTSLTTLPISDTSKDLTACGDRFALSRFASDVCVKRIQLGRCHEGTERWQGTNLPPIFVIILPDAQRSSTSFYKWSLFVTSPPEKCAWVLHSYTLYLISECVLLSNISDFYAQSNTNKDIRVWAKSCIPCQRSKIHPHIQSRLSQVPTDNGLFLTSI